MKKYIPLLFLNLLFWSCTKEIEPAATVGNITTSMPNGGNPPFVVNFTAPIKNAKSYKWEFGDLQKNTSSLQNPSFTYINPGKYTVILRAIGTSGSAGTTNQIEISVPRPNVPSFTVSTPTNNGFAPCDVTYTPTEVLGVNSYVWTLEDTNGNFISQLAASSSAVPQRFTFFRSGNYRIKLTVSNPYNNSNSITSDITINEPIASGRFDKIIASGGAGDDNAYNMVSDDAGNIYVAGNSSGGLVFGSYNVKQTFFVAKINSSGQVLWLRDDGTNSKTSVATGIALDYAGNVCVSYDDNSITNRITGYVKFKQATGADGGGNLQITDPTDSKFQFHINGLSIDKSNNVWIVLTAINSTSSIDRHFRVYKFSANSPNAKTPLSFISGEFAPNSVKNTFSEGYDITVFDNDNIYITGGYSGSVRLANNTGSVTSTSKKNTFLLKLNSGSFPVWWRENNPILSNYEQPENWMQSSIITDNTGSVYMAGCFIGYDTQWTLGNTTLGLFNRNQGGVNNGRDHYLIKFTSSGNIEWLKPTTDNVAIYGIGKNRNNEILVTGSTLDASKADANVYVQKYNSSGDIILNRQPATNGKLSAGAGIAEDNNGNIFIGGRYNQNVTLIGSAVLPRAVGDDIFILKYTK